MHVKELIDRKTVSLIRPDLSLAGGFTHCKKIAGLAEASFVGIFPHLMGTPVNTAAFVQLAAAIPNYVFMETNEGAEEIVDEPVQLEGGYRIVFNSGRNAGQEVPHLHLHILGGGLLGPIG